MTIEELKARPEFAVELNDSQRAFVLAICSNGRNKIEAAQASYTCKDELSAQAIANRNLRHPVMSRLIKDFYGRVDETGSKQEVMAIVWKKIQTGSLDPKELLQYMNFLAKLKGWEATKATDEDAPEEQPDFSFLEEQETA